MRPSGTKLYTRPARAEPSPWQGASSGSPLPPRAVSELGSGTLPLAGLGHVSGGPTVWWRGCPASVCERHQDASEPRGCVVPFKGAAGVMLSQHQALIYGSASTPPHTHARTLGSMAVCTLSHEMTSKCVRPVRCPASSANSREQTQTVKELALGQLALLFEAGASPTSPWPHTQSPGRRHPSVQAGRWPHWVTASRLALQALQWPSA